MKIINTSDKPFRFTFDACNFGPYLPGQVVDLPEDVAAHAIRRSIVLDDAGDFVAYRMEPLSSVDPNRVKDIALIECPFIALNQCNAASFKSADELKAHLESHWEFGPEKQQTLKPAPMPKTKQ